MTPPSLPAPPATVSSLHPRLRRLLASCSASWNRAGEQTQFYGWTVRGIGDAVVHYKVEVVRQIAQMSLGVGALALIGGTVVIVAFLTLSAGSLIAVQSYNQLAQIGVEALAGFTSAFLNVRLVSPLVAGIGLAATIGAGATAQLGAMRISEEIDALEVMGVRSIAFLASTRVLAGVLVVIPLYCIAVIMAFVATRFGTTFIYGQSTGVYDHYFNTFLNPTDLIWSFLQAIFIAIVVMLVHTYYGFTASGGPAGVGDAVGRAVRTSLVATVFVTLFVSLAVYGQSGNFHLSG
jgi:phospholipid/cholesterol/gamma-HCH transport system permease protein